MRHGIMLVGPAGSGKSAICECLAAALTELGTKHVIWRMNPKAITAPQMFGRMDAATGCGLPPNTFAMCSAPRKYSHRVSAKMWISVGCEWPRDECAGFASMHSSHLVACAIDAHCSSTCHAHASTACCDIVQVTGPMVYLPCSGGVQPRPRTKTPGSCWTVLWMPSGLRTSTLCWMTTRCAGPCVSADVIASHIQPPTAFMAFHGMQLLQLAVVSVNRLAAFLPGM